MIFKKDSLVKLQRGTSKHSLNTPRQQIELRKIVGREWKPWSTSMYRDHPDIVHAREISDQRVAFYNPESDTSIMYLGERFLRQTKGFITIPRSPRERLEDLATPHDPIDVVEGRDYKHVDESINISSRKRDEVGAASTQDPTFLLNQVPPIHPSRYKYDNVSQASHQFPRVSFCTVRSDSEGNRVEVPLQAPDPPPFTYDANWGTREQWKDLAHTLNLAKDEYWFEIDRARALGEGSTSTQSCYDLGDNSQRSSHKRPATSQSDDAHGHYVPQDEVVPESQLTQVLNSGGVGLSEDEMARMLGLSYGGTYMCFL
ncbi:hypothetical protein C5167_004772 [Papaver somniferum]|uniref:Uncharacterized protein n=1 Tax=Papaver somniferum TaxID=3469 RepID=A0A4Y7JBM7_PAPSO|nr:hypothetical protein C5167_004772 [Papaver somniferum]